MIFGRKDKKLDPRRRFGSREFRAKVKSVQQHRRPFIGSRQSLRSRLFKLIEFNRKVWIVLLIIAFMVIFYYLVISSHFLVTDITVSGQEQISEQQIKESLSQASQSRLFLIPKNHLLLMTKARVNKLVTESIPLIKEVGSAKRGWPNKIEISVSERKSGFVFVVKDRNFLVDEEGIVIKELIEPEEENLPRVIDQADEDVVVGEILSNPKLVVFIISMSRSWPKKINSEITTISVGSKITNEVEFESQEGWAVFFDVNRSVISQLANLALILSRRIPISERGRLAYIDLRLEKWVYYCFDDTPCSSEPQQNTEGETSEE